MTSTRRDILTALVAAPLVAGRAQAQTPPTTPLQQAMHAVSEGQPISKQALLNVAREMSRVPFSPSRSDVPRALSQLTPEQYRQIRFRPQSRLFLGENRGFTIDLLHQGNVFNTPVAIRTVENGVIRDQRFSVDQFDYNGLASQPTPEMALAYSGFRARAALNQPEPVDEVMSFQGATFFRLLARGQVFGAMARALVLNLGEPQGEEFPSFRTFWIERPGVGATTIVIHALLDSESLSGLYRFAVRPGDITVCDVEATLYPRVDIANIGLAPLSANFLFASNDRTGIDDARNGVHEVSGLQAWTGAGEWIWRPLHNPETLQISAFVDQNPKGFGLMQRDRRFDAYNDLDARFERRPSVWIEPLADWGQGQVQLVEIPVQDETNRNIIAYWRPRTGLTRGSEHSVSYRMSWCWSPLERPPGAWSNGVRVGRAAGGPRRRRFLVDFTAEEFADRTSAPAWRPNLGVNRGRIHNLEGRLVPENKLYRVSFDLDPEAANQVELRLLVERDGTPFSETWLYRWTP